jgi:hypothetical protein
MVSVPGMVYGLRRSLGVHGDTWETLQGAILFYATRSVVPPQIMALKGSPVLHSVALPGPFNNLKEPPQSRVAVIICP